MIILREKKVFSVVLFLLILRRASNCKCRTDDVFPRRLHSRGSFKRLTLSPEKHINVSVMHEGRSSIASLECQNILICNVNLAEGGEKPQATVSGRIYLYSITIYEDSLPY